MDKFVKFIARFSAAVSTICIAALAITVASQVFFRKVLNQSLPGLMNTDHSCSSGSRCLEL